MLERDEARDFPLLLAAAPLKLARVDAVAIEVASDFPLLLAAAPLKLPQSNTTPESILIFRCF